MRFIVSIIFCLSVLTSESQSTTSNPLQARTHHICTFQCPANKVQGWIDSLRNLMENDPTPYNFGFGQSSTFKSKQFPYSASQFNKYTFNEAEKEVFALALKNYQSERFRSTEFKGRSGMQEHWGFRDKITFDARNLHYLINCIEDPSCTHFASELRTIKMELESKFANGVSADIDMALLGMLQNLQPRLD